MIANQKIPPLRKIHAECKKLKFFPNNIQEYAEEAHPIKITPIRRINPKISSSHLFMNLSDFFHLKRFLW